MRNKTRSHQKISKAYGNSSTINRIDKIRKNVAESSKEYKKNVNKKIYVGSLSILLIFALISSLNGTEPHFEGNITDEVNILSKLSLDTYKGPTCECCHLWIEYLEKNTRMIISKTDTTHIQELKEENSIPVELFSCHTAFLENYVIEGHVPILSLIKLINEKPNVNGIAVGGMPLGAPGMDEDGSVFIVHSFDYYGNFEIFMRF